jgi:murein DD-endopeptidase MepM/ murein hydrolase activator NlpD
VVDLPRPAVPHPQAVGARTTGTAQLSPGQWVRPGVGILTSPFGMRWGKLHKGIDLGGPYGSPIYAASDGVVTFAGFKHGYHRYVMVDHGHGLTTAYAHMSATYVHVGQHVRTGEQIAREGTEGTGPHLHFEVWRNGRPVNPIPILRRHGVYI